MKLLKKNVSAKDGEGSALLRADEPEDMWHAYNLICEGDTVRATTIRKVVKEGSTGSTSAQRVRLTLTIEVDAVDFDPKDSCIRLKGRNTEENPHVKLGAYHTLELELNRNFELHKPCWDTIFLERLETACDPGASADLAAVVMQEGHALLCAVTGHMTIVRARIEQSIPRKRASDTARNKALGRFFESIMQSILRHVDFGVVKCVLLCSPGYVKDDFFKFLNLEATRRDLKELLKHKSSFVLCHSSSGHKHALKEVLAQPGIQARLADTKAAMEVKVLNDFFEMMNTDPDRAFYGFNHCFAANERCAVQTLLVTDDLFRSCDIKTRRRYVTLVEAARDAGAAVHIFSSLHVSGEQLKQISGIAALLRFPLPEIEDMELDGFSTTDAKKT